ncbi:ABC transporter ATP-binding protein [Pseudothauera nasutitermitis]|uniref:ABC transporter ATP-binding protein n=1 Tax=Pseudothauera nasutitermitis TaxID=2565930 RepID=A0A4S4AT93_9RHOO|nr:ABC transporter ATP-binding protein [Pseudothauera nasutitermitis]THF63097.1 ABC transporter ATP-binding protein [Pseudothauera nasutitermitis]
MSLFRAQGLVKRFGGLLAADHVDLAVEQGEIHALIGPNGAGKSTLVNLISGLLPADAGRIVLDGVDLTPLSAQQRVRHGLARCFQIASVFRSDSVRDNLLLAVQAQAGSSFRCLRRRESERALMDAAQALAERLALTEVLDRPAGVLPHGMQKRLDVALALAARPRLLLLDEPMAGMGPEDSRQMIELIESLRGEMAILLIEHDMDAVFQLAGRISVLVNGRVLTSGDAAHVRGHAEVQSVYLGTEVPA